SESYSEVFAYIESPVIRRQAVESAKRGARASMLGGTIGYQDIGGRRTRPELRRHDNRPPDKNSAGKHPHAAPTLEWVEAGGGEYSSPFPPPLLFLRLPPPVAVP